MANFAPEMPAGLLSMLQGGMGTQEEQQPESTVEILRRMIEDAKRYIDVEQDPEDKATMSKILQTLLQYEADEQRERDSALGASPAVKYLRRGR